MHELRNHNRIVFRHFCGHIQEAVQLIVVIADIHGSTREHIRRTHQNGETHFLYEFLDVFFRSQRTPCRLVNAEFIEHGREFVAVLSTVDIHG